ALTASIYDVLLETTPGVTLASITQPIQMPNVALAPASIDLSQAELQLMSEMDREQALREALKPTEGMYDRRLTPPLTPHGQWSNDQMVDHKPARTART